MKSSQCDPGSRITCLRLEGDLLVSGSESGLITLTSLTSPGILSPLLQVRPSSEAVRDLALQDGRVVSLSADARLRVWTVRSDRCISNISLENEKLSKISVNWPLCIIAGLDNVLLWDLEKSQQLQRLQLAGGGVGSVVTITRHQVLVGDTRGSLSIWSLQDLIDGHEAEEDKTRKTVECFEPENVISGVCSLAADKILVTGWNGKCCLFSF